LTGGCSKIFVGTPYVFLFRAVRQNVRKKNKYFLKKILFSVTVPYLYAGSPPGVFAKCCILATQEVSGFCNDQCWRR
jgi:hypothetical protein